MLKEGEVCVWRVRLDRLQPGSLPEPTPGEAARAALFQSDEARSDYLRSHGALRAILGGYTDARLDFALGEKGKPYLPFARHLRFSLSRSHRVALIAVALDVEVGVDVERVRPIPESTAIAERFFPPSEAAAFALTPADEREKDFFRRWARIEAALKARGVGLYGAGAELDGGWTAADIDAGDEYAAAVAATKAGMSVRALELGAADDHHVSR